MLPFLCPEIARRVSAEPPANLQRLVTGLSDDALCILSKSCRAALLPIIYGELLKRRTAEEALEALALAGV